MVVRRFQIEVVYYAPPLETMDVRVLWRDHEESAWSVAYEACSLEPGDLVGDHLAWALRLAQESPPA